MKHDTAGDPITGMKWSRKTTEKIAKELERLSIAISPNTVGRLLKDMRFSLRVNHKKRELQSKNPPSRKIRDQQFEYISQMREAFASRGSPIISVDAKKKELVGNFKNNGTSWEREPYIVGDHDFPSYASGIAIPYGIYDTLGNRGFIVVGISHETPAFAVDALGLWWKACGSNMYPEAKELLVLADGGGSNGSRCRAWKYRLQNQFCSRYCLTVTVCHYPPGASKWNPIEHRLFSEISKNWAGKPLESYETLLNYVRTTKTSSGLRVRARLMPKYYDKGERISDDEMEELAFIPHETFSNWNYTFIP